MPEPPRSPQKEWMQPAFDALRGGAGAVKRTFHKYALILAEKLAKRLLSFSAKILQQFANLQTERRSEGS